jgi:uncharacterized caspase-like protein
MKSSFVPSTILLAFLGVFSLAGCRDLFSNDDDNPKTNWAVIVGVAGYKSPTFNLKWADEDALDLYDALRNSKGWETDNLTLLTNSSATKDAIKAALGRLAKRVGADDRVLFYFSGRGSYGPDRPPFDEGDGLDEYLVPFDAQPNSPANDLSDDELEALLSALPTNNVVVVLDVGFAGGTTSSGIPSAKDKCLLRSSGSVVVAPRTVDGMSHDLARPGYVFISAAQNGVAPAESSQLRNGVFTYYFVEGLRGAASNNGKRTSAQQAYAYAAPRTAAYESGQSPQMIDNKGKRFDLTAR